QSNLDGPFGPKLRWLCAKPIDVVLNSSANATMIFVALMMQSPCDSNNRNDAMKFLTRGRSVQPLPLPLRPLRVLRVGRLLRIGLILLCPRSGFGGAGATGRDGAGRERAVAAVTARSVGAIIALALRRRECGRADEDREREHDRLPGHLTSPLAATRRCIIA